MNLGGVVKTLQRSNSLSRSIFSTAGSFGLVDVSDIFLIFWGSGRGKDEAEPRGGGEVGCSLKIPGRGGGGSRRGAEREDVWGIFLGGGVWGGGGLDFFFSGPKRP